MIGKYFRFNISIQSSNCFHQEEYISWLIDKEIAIMSVLDHAHIVHLNEVFDEDDTVCFVIELAKGGEVFDRLIEQGNFGENQARF